MKTLKDAWDWYESARTNLLRIQRLGDVHWEKLALLDCSLWTDERFKRVKSTDLIAEANSALEPLDDLGIVVFFSVFEAAVRDYLEAVVRPMTGTLGHPILEHAAAKAIEGIVLGSFANYVLKPLLTQKRIPAALAAKVNEVRHYRNWVSHGKREPRGPGVVNLNAKQAYDRLKDFLHLLGIAVEPELLETEAGEKEHPDR